MAGGGEGTKKASLRDLLEVGRSEAFTAKLSKSYFLSERM